MDLGGRGRFRVPLTAITIAYFRQSEKLSFSTVTMI